MLTRLDPSAGFQGMACETYATSLNSPREKKYLADLLLTFSRWLMNFLIGESFDNPTYLG